MADKLYLKRNGELVEISCYDLPVASSDTLGGVKVGTNLTITNSVLSAKDTTYSNFVKSGTGAKAGLVPSPGTTAGTTKYLREDGTWQIPPNTNTDTHWTSHLYAGASGTAANATTTNGNTTLVLADNSTVRANIKIKGSGATSVVSDASGNITISSTDTNTVYTHPSHTAKAAGFYKVTVDSLGHVTAAAAVTKADITALGIPGSDTNTTYSNFTKATASAAGTAGLVPAPAAGKQASFLRGDATWAVPTNTTYSVFTGATADAAGSTGLVPKPAKGEQAKVLTGNCDWTTINSLVYGAGSLAANGYIKFSNGLIIQWGAASGSGTTTFPLAFASACYAVIIGMKDVSSPGTSGGVTAKTKTNFTAGSAHAFYWVAFGK